MPTASRALVLRKDRWLRAKWKLLRAEIDLDNGQIMADEVDERRGRGA